MNLYYLTARIAEKTDTTPKIVNLVIKELLTEIRTALLADSIFSFTNFGTFSTKTLKARTVHCPSTGPISVPTTTTVRFKPAPQLKTLLNPTETTQ